MRWLHSSGRDHRFNVASFLHLKIPTSRHKKCGTNFHNGYCAWRWSDGQEGLQQRRVTALSLPVFMLYVCKTFILQQMLLLVLLSISWRMTQTRKHLKKRRQVPQLYLVTAKHSDAIWCTSSAMHAPNDLSARSRALYELCIIPNQVPSPAEPTGALIIRKIKYLGCENWMRMLRWHNTWKRTILKRIKPKRRVKSFENDFKLQ